jgi:antitoxin ParD1/3/4
MPTRNVNLTEELDSFVAARVASGRYADASEVMRAALRALERDEQAFEEKMAALQKALEDGLASGDAEPGVFERVRAYIDELCAQDYHREQRAVKKRSL